MAMDDQYNPTGRTPEELHRPNDADAAAPGSASDPGEASPDPADTSAPGEAAESDASPANTPAAHAAVPIRHVARPIVAPAPPVEQPMGLGAHLPDQLDLSADAYTGSDSLLQAREAARRKVSLRVSIPLFALLALIIGSTIYMAATRVTKVDDADRAAVVTAEMVAAKATDHFKVRDGFASYNKSTGDGRTRLEYSYDDVFIGDDGVSVACTIVVARDEIDAKKVYTSLNTETRVESKSTTPGLSLSKPMTFETRDEMYAWGDTSTCAVILRDKKPIGNYFLCRKDRHVFMLMTTGAVIEKPEDLKALLEPVLDKLTAYGTASAKAAKPNTPSEKPDADAPQAPDAKQESAEDSASDL
ncbi:MAG: hypothetical protein GC159_12130 [Phycisphaera sp.]|nr:hypothetical protein [Phycisphaera sp.]